MSTFILNNQHYSIEDVFSILQTEQKVILGDKAKEAILKCRAYLDQKVERGGEIS